MSIDERVHLRRDRAESFGAVAANYDRYRPGYPSQLIDELVGLSPSCVLDVGCGTGKAAVLLAARGLSVVGVEPDPQMAAVAARHGVDVEVSDFESWPSRGRRFDLITAGQSWHWIDPAVGAQKAADLLAPGGTLALFWNHRQYRDAATDAAFADLYRVHAPDLARPGSQLRTFAADRPYAGAIEASGRFATVEVTDYPYEEIYTSDEWAGVLQTHSDHLLLEPRRRAALVDAVRALVDCMGGTVGMDAGTYTIFAKQAA